MRCLQNQTLQELEFIFIDDKGCDGSFDIILGAASTDSRIVCIANDTNRGPGASRNKGIEIARGEFIAFVDADDMISHDFYEKLYEKAQKTGALVVKGQCCKIYEDGEEKISNLNQRISRQLTSSPQSMLMLWTYEHTAGIYSRNLVMQTGARNCETARRDQDTCFLMQLMMHVKPCQFAMENGVVYYYVQNNSSLVHLPRNAYLLEQLRLSAEFKVNHLMKYIEREDCASYLSMIINLRLLAIIDEPLDDSVSNDDIISYVDYFSGVIRNWRNDNIDSYKEQDYAAILRFLDYSAIPFYSIEQWYHNCYVKHAGVDMLSKKAEECSHYLVDALKKARKYRKLLFLYVRKKFSYGVSQHVYKRDYRLHKDIIRKYERMLNDIKLV